MAAEVHAVAGAVMEISVVFTAYNEEQAIRSTISRALDALREQFETFEILLVNDASRDSTGRICDELAKSHREIRVVHNSKNLGQGASLVRGFQEAQYGLVTFDAVDYPFDLRDLRLMVPLLKEADIVVAARRSRAGYSGYRVLTSVVNRALLSTLFPLRLRDYNFVQLYPRKVWETIKVESRSTAFLTPEVLIRAHDLGYRIREVDIEYHPRVTGTATSGKPKVVLRSLRDMARFWWSRNIRRKFRRRT
jgi:glycosyltransferase involved in cell wall biosynthesis